MRLNELIDHLADGTPVVAVNRRLARRLVAEYDLRQQQAGRRTWFAPQVMTYEVWLRGCLDRLGRQQQLLSAAEVRAVWREILFNATSGSAGGLLQLEQTVQMAIDAMQLLNRFEVSFSTDAAADDHRAFLGWCQEWSERAQANGWLDSSMLPGLIADAVSAGELPVPPALVFAGFDLPDPADRRLRAALASAGCHPIDWQLPERAGGTVLAIDPASLEEEVRLCGRWARHLLLAEPLSRVAVVAPQLEQYRPLIETLFTAEVDPGAVVHGANRSQVINLSLGERLDRVPVVKTLLTLLAVGYRLDLPTIGWLLRTPYIAASVAEQFDRALADKALREKNSVGWTVKRLARTLRPLQVPQFVALLEQITEREEGPCKPGTWSRHFRAEITRYGWPGERSLSSHDYQAVDHLYRALEQFSSLDRICRPLRRREAVALFGQMLSETVFQPETEEGGVEVLGLLEAAGQEFDHLWVLGLHDAALPRPAQPNPFIPLSLQRLHCMPHADADRELAFARSIAAHLFTAADDVVLSWPRTRDGAPCRPSPLLRPIVAGSPKFSEPAHPAGAIHRQAPDLESVNDQCVAPLHARKAVAGGTGLLKDQAICPFRAFVHHRLRAEALANPDLGLDGLARGNLIHAVLELFWKKVGSQQQLLQLSTDDCEQLLRQVTEEAITRFERLQRADLSLRQHQLESDRLTRLAGKWLAVDRQRPPFTARVEERLTETVGPLQLKTRIDRIDQLDNGRIAIIDYKSGNTTPDFKQWLDARVTEPQLPIYSLELEPDQLDGVLFAHLRGNDQPCRFVGLARSPEDWPGLSAAGQAALFVDRGVATFDAALLHWRTVLPQIAESFVCGEITVAPVDPKHCDHCDVRPVCRIDDVDSFGVEANHE